MNDGKEAEAVFERHARCYGKALYRGLSLSGESREYFARGRVDWLARRLTEQGIRARRVMDFGCGTGSTVPLLLDRLHAEKVVGVDVSETTLAIARQTCRHESSEFHTVNSYCSQGTFDLAYCNGVFHHIEPDERMAALAWLRVALKPRGWLALYENNPWNLGTHLVMARIPFDRGAKKIAPPACRRMLAGAGFETIAVDYLFFFPRLLKFLRRTEPSLSHVPLGAQYLALARALDA
jgi:SAM-dependent methyltransferase